MALPIEVVDEGHVLTSYGAVIGFYPGDSRFEITVERADDNGSGAPNLATVVVLGLLDSGEQVFIDDTAGSAGLIYHYRGRHTRRKYIDGANTSWIAVNTVRIPETIPDRPPVVPMSFDIGVVETTGVVSLKVDGAPSFRSVKWATSLVSFPDPTTGTVAALDAEGDATINPSVTLARGDELFVALAFYGLAGGAGPVLGTLRRSFTFFRASFIPAIAAEWLRVNSTTASLDLTIDDPLARVTSIKHKEREGSQAADVFTSYSATWDRTNSSATPGGRAPHPWP